MGQEVGSPLEFISGPLAAAVTISGTVTFNLWTDESNMNANAGPQVVIDRLDNTGSIISTVINSESGVESGTAFAVTNWTGSPTSTSFAKGDRIRIRYAANDAGGTIGAGFSWRVNQNGPTPAADGDTWVEFTETFTLQEETAPAGTKLYLLDAASDIVDQGAGVIEKEMWTSPGDGLNTAVRNTVAGPTVPLQWTSTAGGDTIEWYTPQLAAFTLSGVARASVWGLQSAGSTRAMINGELAVVDDDGTESAIYGSWGMISSDGSGSGELPTAAAQQFIFLGGPDIDVDDGQRLRLRLRLDDCGNGVVVTARTVTIDYDGTTDSADGDTWLQLTEDVEEFTPAEPSPLMWYTTL